MDSFAALNIEEPIDLVKLCLNHNVRIKLRYGREIRGKLHAFDAHLNLLIGDAEETHTTTEQDPDTKQNGRKVVKRLLGMTYLRGDQVVLVSPDDRPSK